MYVFLETPRLRLRRFGEADIPALLAYRQNPEVARYQSWKPLDMAEARAFIAALAHATPGETVADFTFAVARRDTDALVGDLFLHPLPYDPQQAEIGYTFARDVWGQGYATEALSALLAHLFDTLDLHRVIAYTAAANHRSVALLERVGLRREGHFRLSFRFSEMWEDEYAYALLAEEWRLDSSPRPVA